MCLICYYNVEPKINRPKSISIHVLKYIIQHFLLLCACRLSNNIHQTTNLGFFLFEAKANKILVNRTIGCYRYTSTKATCLGEAMVLTKQMISMYSCHRDNNKDYIYIYSCNHVAHLEAFYYFPYIIFRLNTPFSDYYLSCVQSHVCMCPLLLILEEEEKEEEHENILVQIQIL